MSFSRSSDCPGRTDRVPEHGRPDATNRRRHLVAGKPTFGTVSGVMRSLCDRPLSLMLDVGSGREVPFAAYKAALGGRVTSGPMSYSVGGRQYVAVAAGSGLFSYALRQP